VTVTVTAVRPVPFESPVAAALTAAAVADLAQRYGGDGDSTPMNAAEFAPPDGEFLVAWSGDVPVGCGGWRTLATDATVAEVKRMYTVPRWRGRGVAAAVLRAIEESARAAGKRRVVLETGSGQPEAIAFYQKQGYDRIPNFGYYRDHPGCVSFGRDL
jgi:GNAT superfamily N-acetyltransferase